jgi:hypothetical protein
VKRTNVHKRLMETKQRQNGSGGHLLLQHTGALLDFIRIFGGKLNDVCSAGKLNKELTEDESNERSPSTSFISVASFSRKAATDFLLVNPRDAWRTMRACEEKEAGVNSDGAARAIVV